ITAYYVFCREIDDIVDEALNPDVAAQKLAWWREEVARAFGGKATHPAMQALAPHLKAYDLAPHVLLGVIEGCEMDLQQARYANFEALAHYCHLVAGVVGEAAARIFAPCSEATIAYAHRLGLALQLTNIIRDVGEDARRGRIYLPVDELQQHGVPASDLLEARYSDNFTALMRQQAARAHEQYDAALALLPAAERRAQKPGLMMASIYRTLLREIEASGFAVLHQRITLPPVRKLWLAWKMQALGSF
ncbi:MAG: presqualene diphosphate synthase HpnD, partial [Ottowia sp.]|nr:presqualene diphosphate synthase HpnD [Ottowia sp.]